MSWLNSGINNTMFSVNDYIHYSGDNYLAYQNDNNLLKQIDNGIIHKTNVSKKENIIFQPSNLSTIPDYIYTTKHKWAVYRIVQPSSIFGPEYEYINATINPTGYLIELRHIYPQSLRSYRSEYIYPDYDRLNEFDNGSILLINNSGDVFNYHSNRNTYSLDNFDNRIYYGGVFNDNNINITNIKIKERILNHLMWSRYVNNASGIAASCSSNSYYDCSWTGVYGYGYLWPDNTNRQYVGNLQSSNLTSLNNSVGFANAGFDIFKDSISYFNGVIDTGKSEGEITLDYTFYKNQHSCYTDYYPDGFRIVPTGQTIDNDAGQYINTLTIGYGEGIYPYSLSFYKHQLGVLDIAGSNILFSSGQIIIKPEDDLSVIENKFSGISPYGINCYGQNINHMFVVAKGFIHSGDLSSGLMFKDFNYTVTDMNLSIKYNKLNNHGGTTGEIDNSGNIIWSHNHGQDLIKYNEIISSGTQYPSGHTEAGLFVPPNHIGEMYRVDYDRKTGSLYTTGNLVKKQTFPSAMYYLMPSSIIHFEASSIMMTTGDYFLQFGTTCGSGSHCIVPTSVFTGLQSAYIPTGFIVSNFDSLCNSGECSGLLEYKMDKNSLQYYQNKTSTLECGNKIVLGDNLIAYTGEYPNIPNGLLPLFINLED